MRTVVVSIVGLIALLLLVGAIVVAGWWGLFFGIFLVIAITLLVVSSLGIFSLRGGGIFISAIAVICVVGIIYLWYHQPTEGGSCETASKKSGTYNAKLVCVATPPASTMATITRFAAPPVTPTVVTATTPVAITADYEFNIESDGPINVQYPGDKPVLYTPGKGFQQLPEPRSAGPKVFTDPDDPKNGHITFRLYPVHQGR